MGYKIETTLPDLVHQGILPAHTTYQPLSGGTVSEVGLLSCAGGAQYVYKSGELAVLAAEVAYLQRYRGSVLVPAVKHVDAEGRFLIMEHVAGETKFPVPDKKALLITLVQEVINRYESLASTEKWGWLDAPTSSWSDFLVQEVLKERNTIGSHLSEADHQFIFEIVKRKKATVPYLLHGDFGAHNFLFANDKLVGVIDPFPVIGEPIYDLIYTFCSTHDDLNCETILPAVALLRSDLQPKDADHLAREILIGLYLRMGKCIRHHQYDLPAYLAAWEVLKGVTRSCNFATQEREWMGDAQEGRSTNFP